MPLSLNFSPFPGLETSRLKLRALKASDAADILFFRSDEGILKYISSPRCTDLNDALLFINRMNNNTSNNESLYWGIHLKNETNLIGMICLWNISVENARGEIGYIIHPDFQRKGLMNEAINAVLNYTFQELNFHSLEAVINPLNEASINILLKNKFVREAYFRENNFHNGRFEDTAVYSLLKKEWRI